MFSKTSKIDRSQGKMHPLALPQPSPASTTAPCFIPADIVVTGDISTVGEIQFDGNIAGNLRGALITIGQTATIRGDIVAEEVIVRGHVIGTITGRRVHLSGTSLVKGDIHHGSMGMEMGARIDGCCRYAAEPLALAAPIAPAALPKPEDRSVSDSGINKGGPSSLAAAASAPVVSSDSERLPGNDLEALKSTSSKMRARTSKPSLSAAARKPNGLGAVIPTERNTAAPVEPNCPAGTQPGEADLQSDASPESKPLWRTPVAS